MSQILKARKRLKMTQEEMADALHMSPSSISRLERGVMVESARIVLMLRGLIAQKEGK